MIKVVLNKCPICSYGLRRTIQMVNCLTNYCYNIMFVHNLIDRKLILSVEVFFINSCLNRFKLINGRSGCLISLNRKLILTIDGFTFNPKINSLEEILLLA